MYTFTVKGYILTVETDNAAFEKFDVPSIVPAAMVDRPIRPETNGHVVVTSSFESLSKSTREILLTHEAAHVACNHLEGVGSELVINPQIEAEADAWACDIVGANAFDRACTEAIEVLCSKLISLDLGEHVAGVKHGLEERKRIRLEWISNNR